MKIRARENDTELKLQMSAMVDMVFILLVFFVMTFRIVPMEGDFNIAMPKVGPGTSPELLPEMDLRLHANANGELARIRFNGRPMASLDQVHDQLRELVASIPNGDREELSLTIHADSELSYAHTMDAISAVSGYREDGVVVGMIQRVKFAPLNAPG